MLRFFVRPKFMRKMALVYFLCVLIWIYQSLIGTGGTLSQTKTNRPVLVISFDGFRWDYLDIVKAAGNETPEFDSLITSGVKAKWMKNAYVTLTFPNHYTIATGMYEENHGVISNTMYDSKFNESFTNSKGQAEDPKWWNNGSETWPGEPIWLTNQQKEDQRSGVYYWIGSEAAIRGKHPFHYEHYNWNVSLKAFQNRVDTVIDWFTDKETPVNFVMLYFEEPDHTGHSFGPNSKEIINKVLEMDGLVGYLKQRLKAVGLFEDMDIIITSDHGMTEMNNVVYLEDYVNSSLYKVYGEPPVLHLLPNEGQESVVYNSLLQAQNLHVYRKDEIPLDYHYHYNRRIQPIIVESYEGFLVCKERAECYTGMKGDHGYNNSYPHMRPFFIAHGPAFKQNYISEPFNNVDIYPLLCHMLGVKPAQHDGDLDNIRHILADHSGKVEESDESHGPPTAILTAMGTILGVIFLVSGIYCLIKFTPAPRSPLRKQFPPTGETESAGLLTPSTFDDFV